MKRGSWIGCAVGLMVSAATAAAGSGKSLDIKTGLWEMSVVTESSGKLPMSDEEMRKLTPRQRAAIEKAVGANNGPRTRVIKSCVTREKLDRHNVFESAEAGMTCNNKKLTETRTDVTGSITCSKGAKRMSEEFSYHVRDREHVVGTFHVVRSEGANTLSVKGKQSGHWIGAACGATK